MNQQADVAAKLRLAGAAAQARAITRGDISSAALMEAEVAALENQNPALNAFIAQVERTEPQVTDHPSVLFGTSFAVKDNFDVAGFPTQAGLRAMSSTPAENDATVVARLKRAGLVFGGKLNMSPMAVGSSTHNRDFGDCFNPLRSGYSAGGSSGGSASAVAAGLVGIALGTDTMGSVRLPAAFCGIVGFKPSWGRLPVDGLVPLSRMLDHIGVLSRTVEDATLAYSILRGQGDVAANATSQQSDVSATRIGYVSDTACLELEPEIESAYTTVCQRLRDSGYTLTPVDAADLQLSSVRRSGLMVCEAELLNTLAGLYPEHRERIPPELISLLDFIAGQSAASVGRALSRLARAKERFMAMFDNVDVLALPTCGHTAFSMTEPVPENSADLTVIANVLGAPAISLPQLQAQGGLPSALQLIGRNGQDEALLALSGKLESVVGA